MKKAVPRFRNEDEEREFWAKRDSTAFISWKKGKRVILPDLKPLPSLERVLHSVS